MPFSDNLHLSARAKLRYKITDSIDMQAVYLLADISDTDRIDALNRGDYRLNDNRDQLLYLRTTYKSENFIKKITFNISCHQIREHVDRYKCLTNDNGSVVDLESCINSSNARPGREPALKTKVNNDEKIHVVGVFMASDFSFLDDDLTTVLGAEMQHEWISSKKRTAADDYNFEDVSGSFPDGATYLSYGAYVHLNYIPLHFSDEWHDSINSAMRFVGALANADTEDFGNLNVGF